MRVLCVFTFVEDDSGGAYFIFRFGGGGKLYELIFFSVSIYDPIEKLSISFARVLKIIVSSREVKNRIFSGIRDGSCSKIIHYTYTMLSVYYSFFAYLIVNSSSESKIVNACFILSNLSLFE